MASSQWQCLRPHGHQGWPESTDDDDDGGGVDDDNDDIDNEDGVIKMIFHFPDVTTSYSGISGFLPVQTYPPFNVFCTPDAWIIIMRRTEMDISFDREWDEFKEGFGDLTGKYTDN